MQPFLANNGTASVIAQQRTHGYIVAIFGGARSQPMRRTSVRQEGGKVAEKRPKDGRRIRNGWLGGPLLDPAADGGWDGINGRCISKDDCASCMGRNMDGRGTPA